MVRRKFARGRHRPGVMNQTEAAYAERLRLDPLVDTFWFEGIKLRLADKTFYTPDYFVMLKTGELEAHEVKGFWMDDARVKIKVAAETYPFRFIAVTYKRKEWHVEEI
jgi:hypothetical protein